MIEAGKVTAILLAAGRSERFGLRDKLVVDLEGQPLVLHAANAIAGLRPARRIAVCASRDAQTARLLAALDFEIVENPDAERGLSHSLACGIARAADGDEEAALICLGDMPFVSVAQLRGLLARFDPVTAPVVASSRNGIPLPPALFARSLFGRLAEAQGDQGGRAMLAGAVLLPASDAELADVDVPDDLPPTL